MYMYFIDSGRQIESLVFEITETSKKKIYLVFEITDTSPKK